MKFAYVDNIKTEAKPNLTGLCISCAKDVRSYCGDQIIHHWKHINLSECDFWYERETEWHRNWKNHFDISYQEIVKFDTNTKEKHIADIYLPQKDLVIEFQHSAVEIDEIKARELFYNRMIWVIDLTSVKNNIEFHKDKNDLKFLFDKMKSQLPKEFEIDKEFQESHSKNNEVADFLDFLGIGKEKIIESQYIAKLEDKYYSLCQKDEYYLMTWKNLHKRWDFSEKPKFIDFGDDNIYQLIERIKTGSAYIVKRYNKKYFIEHYK
mgnify:FL=1|jgi:competence CoiA-like predicted nuclease